MRQGINEHSIPTTLPDAGNPAIVCSLLKGEPVILSGSNPSPTVRSWNSGVPILRFLVAAAHNLMGQVERYAQ